MSGHDFYQTLGVHPTASQEDIKTAFKALALKHHPDRHPNAPTKADPARRFQLISEAYDTLSSADKRRQYDSSRLGGWGGAQSDAHRRAYGRPNNAYNYSAGYGNPYTRYSSHRWNETGGFSADGWGGARRGGYGGYGPRSAYGGYGAGPGFAGPFARWHEGASRQNWPRLLLAGAFFWVCVFGGWGASQVGDGGWGKEPEYYRHTRMRHGSMDHITQPTLNRGGGTFYSAEDAKLAASDPELRAAALRGSAAFHDALRKRRAQEAERAASRVAEAVEGAGGAWPSKTGAATRGLVRGGAGAASGATGSVTGGDRGAEAGAGRRDGRQAVGGAGRSGSGSGGVSPEFSGGAQSGSERAGAASRDVAGRGGGAGEGAGGRAGAGAEVSMVGGVTSSGSGELEGRGGREYNYGLLSPGQRLAHPHLGNPHGSGPWGAGSDDAAQDRGCTPRRVVFGAFPSEPLRRRVYLASKPKHWPNRATKRGRRGEAGEGAKGA